jgi:exopolyphosphatase / guanosine-5'-triphosphate,3'-diphosphate pyrophosphatase
MTEIKPRYEFRIWADKLTPVREQLQTLAEPREMVSRETYLISSATDRCNAKIRAGLMDIKVLVAEDRGLEQWKPVLKEGFPLTRAAISDQVFPSLEVASPSLAKAEYSLEDFFEQVIRPQPGIAIVEVSKTRYQFGIGVCSAEYAAVTINGAPRDTVAVESIDPDAVLQLVNKLGINETNISYIREIKRIVG